MTTKSQVWNPQQCAARERCKACWRINAVGFSVPDDVWTLAVPDLLKNRVLCIVCFADFADERGVKWDDRIEFFPVDRLSAVSRSHD